MYIYKKRTHTYMQAYNKMREHFFLFMFEYYNVKKN